MHIFLYVTLLITFFFKCIQCYVIRNNDIEQIANNIETLMKPLRSIYGTFPNREFEMQFDFEHVNYDRPKGHPRHSIMRSKTVEEASRTTATDSTTTTDPGKQIVYMTDLKKALEEYEKKHPCDDCNKKVPTVQSLLLSNSVNPSLSDVLRLIKKGAILQNYTPKPGDDGLSWIKIKVPAA